MAGTMCDGQTCPRLVFWQTRTQSPFTKHRPAMKRSYTPLWKSCLQWGQAVPFKQRRGSLPNQAVLWSVPVERRPFVKERHTNPPFVLMVLTLPHSRQDRLAGDALGLEARQQLHLVLFVTARQ